MFLKNGSQQLQGERKKRETADEPGGANQKEGGFAQCRRESITGVPEKKFRERRKARSERKEFLSGRFTKKRRSRKGFSAIG